jgi:hypothetical protein
MMVAPSLKATLPVGEPPAGVVVMAALKVTDCPNTEVPGLAVTAVAVVALPMVKELGAETELEKLAFPAKAAVMLCGDPTAVKLVVQVALAVPVVCAVHAMVVVPSRKLMRFPGGAPEPGVLTDTVALKTTDCPVTKGPPTIAARAVVVVAGQIVSVVAGVEVDPVKFVSPA